MTNFIVVTTCEVSALTGQPKLFAINVDRVSTVEPAVFEEAYNADEAHSIDGCCIHVDVNVAYYQEINVRDPFDHVIERLRLAGANVYG